MRSQATQTNTGTSPWIPVSQHPTSMVSYGARITAGTPTYDIEYTYENVIAGAAPTAVFKDATGKTTNFDNTLQKSIAALRINITVGSGTVVMDVLQGVKE